MKIQTASIPTPYSDLKAFSNLKQTTANIVPNYSDSVSISQDARKLLSTQSKSTVPPRTTATAVFDTDQGSKNVNIDDYFSTGGSTNEAPFLLQELPPLLLPTKSNIETLTNHISTTFSQFLSTNNIPSAPSSITYDREGQIQLPSDYAYAPELEQALADNPKMARELQTVHALSSHFVEMRKSYSFQQEYAATKTEAAGKAVVDKYSYLFTDNRDYSTIALYFKENGSLSISVDGKPL